MLDLAPWLTPIEGENPCGSDLAYDDDFAALVQRLKAQADLSDSSGAEIDWAAVLADADALRARGRDLRLMVIVARALVNQDGFAGLADGLTLINRAAEAHWDTLHPTSPQRRISSLGMLEDRNGILGDLRKRIAVNARSFGTFTVAQIERSAADLNEITAGMSDKERATAAGEHEELASRVSGACSWVAEHFPEEIGELSGDVAAASAALQQLQRDVGGRLGPMFKLAELEKCLGRTMTVIGRVAKPVAPELTEAIEEGEVDGAVSSVAPPAAVPGRIGSREDVAACLTRIIEFYDRTEPASPVPFLARRMLRMVPMDFLQLMEELAPSGIKEFRALAGIGEDGKPASRS
ncbi:MAG: type VI secretion system protein TssA [Amaricoccus sp.]